MDEPRYVEHRPGILNGWGEPLQIKSDYVFVERTCPKCGQLVVTQHRQSSVGKKSIQTWMRCCSRMISLPMPAGSPILGDDWGNAASTG